MNPGTELRERIRALIAAPEGVTVRVLDVGAGPLTALGKVWPGRTLELTAVDPLADEYNAILDYLAKNYPAEEIPKLNANKATAIEFESRLTLTRSQAAALIEYRTKNGPFKSIDDLKKVPGVDAAKIEAKKDRIVF